MPSRTAQLAGQSANERSPLLLQRESTLEYVTHVPEDAPVVGADKNAHFNLAGLSRGDFWMLVSDYEREIEIGSLAPPADIHHSASRCGPALSSARLMAPSVGR